MFIFNFLRAGFTMHISDAVSDKNYSQYRQNMSLNVVK